MKVFSSLVVVALAIAMAATIDAKRAKIPVHPVEAAAGSLGYRIGRGIYDITGPASNVGMMGYAMFDQVSAGVSSRLRARAFIFEGPSRFNNKTTNRFVFVTTDSCMIFRSVKQQVVARLKELYGNTYGEENVMLSGEHTHSGPAGFSYYLLYDLSSRGFQPENFKVIVDGIVAAITKAHNSMTKGGRILINKGELLEANINRSPTAYTANPEEEKAKYKYDVDKDMTLIRLEDENGKELGAINWFAVHGTSMNNTNLLISPDNKGYASYLFEKYKNGDDVFPGHGDFVSGFAQSNEGDVSPNTMGAHCPDGTPCETVHSTCGGLTEGCIASGPGKTDFESMTIIGTKQFEKAKELYESANKPIAVSVDYVHRFIDMQNVQVDAKWNADGKPGRTCGAALGDSFAGGTTDGPGDFTFTQGVNVSTANPYWNLLGSFIFPPSHEDILCQQPKPILLNVGRFRIPAQWVSDILPIQIARIGDLVIVAVPGEFSTMSGRRLRDTVFQTLKSMNAADENTHVVIAGLSNDYSHYITTREEYGFQRYEGASTIFGPHTLAAYQQEFSKLAVHITKGTKPEPPFVYPADLSSSTVGLPSPYDHFGIFSKFFKFIAIHIPFTLDFDLHPLGTPYGTVLQDVTGNQTKGSIIKVKFQGSNLRRNYRTQDTFVKIDRKTDNGWKTVRTDADFDNKLKWAGNWIRESEITVEWATAPDTPAGYYRISFFGTSKALSGELSDYTAVSSTFYLK